MADVEHYTEEDIIQALRQTKGMVYLAAEMLGCSGQTVYNYRDRYPEVKREIDHQREKKLDIAELKLYKAINDGEEWAVKYVLSRQGKDRGYTEKTEQSHSFEDSLITIRLAEIENSGLSRPRDRIKEKDSG